MNLLNAVFNEKITDFDAVSHLQILEWIRKS